MHKPVLVQRNVGKYRRWPLHLYLCHCGKSFTCGAARINNGETKSCGCLRRSMTISRNKSSAHIDKVTKHGHSKRGLRKRTYNIWLCMVNRTTNPRSSNWKYYGGRGITLCDRWGDYQLFLEDMGECPTDLTIDRIDNDGNYELKNCRWATRKQQLENRRPSSEWKNSSV
jgi:hypothetical protein